MTPHDGPDLDRLEAILVDSAKERGKSRAEIELDDARALLALARRQADEVERLKAGIREHRDQRSDDRCWLDDQKLYALLDDGQSARTGLPPKDEFLKSCERFWCSRQAPGDPGPEGMTIAQLQAEVERLRLKIRTLDITPEEADLWTTQTGTASLGATLADMYRRAKREVPGA